MTVPPLDCLEVVQRLWDFLDREVSAAEDAALRHHLASCTGCTEHIAFCRSFLHTLRTSPLPPVEVAAARTRVLVALHGSDHGA